VTETTQSAPPKRFGDFEFDSRARQLSKRGHRIRLHGQPLEILGLLLERPAEVVLREELRAKLWPEDTFVDFEHSLNAAVNKLREALGDDANNPRFIETVPRRGYRFVAQVEGALSASPPDFTNRSGSTVKQEAAQVVVEKPAAAVPMSSGTRTVRRAVWLAFIACAFLAAFLVGFDVGGLRQRFLGTPDPGTIRSLAVLPLANLSHDPEQEYFADGMTEELITELGKVAALRVISHTSVNRFKGTKKPLQEIARELQVDAIMEGSVSREAHRIRVTANLIQASPEKHLWAESYDRDLRTVLDLQSEVARTIADRVKITVTPGERLRLSATQTVNPEAFELYLKGTFYNNKWTKEGFERGIEYFNQALQKEPRNARAYAGLAVAYGGLGIYGDIAAYPKQKASALKALEINNTLADAHNTLAWAKFTYDWDTAGAEQEFRRAIELNPSDARAHAWYGIFLAMRGRIEDSLQQVKSARDLDPISLANTSLAFKTYYNARDYDKAIEVCRNALEMDASFVPAHHRLIAIYEQKGELDKAIEERQRAVALGGGNPVIVGGGRSQELARQVESLRKAYAANGAHGYWLRRLEADRKDVRLQNADPIDLAGVHMRLGNKDEAFRWLEKALEDHLPYLIWSLPADPAFDDLRSDPRYADLMRRLVPRPE
jgi:TolB-like protein/DNA-binding winged helix-turn-helix (wHTH) protein/tetratricopeptide (TPR) repeat protein